ncbi:glycosyltransferase family 9 protein [Tamlana fucoidanivorans]|uniref:Glycosyltransferase family 9 protein n=1 Tax=Allotamlana fucoidanivorans TaxID=2583814 RepID=A0A5C4SHZ3_9FLAO|nr:glycosyltransferase family 9 protein [Tamlana fucoidanivorans]TNJ43173.1 glycosyltransferase family 9 protein [Tamlana fucoidanivorans]
MKILVIQQKMIGDVLTSSILFEVLRHEYPKAQLDYLINDYTYPVVENNPFIDNFIFFTKKEEQIKHGLFVLAKKIKAQQYDVVIDVYSKLSSNIISLYSGAKIKISYYKLYTAWIYNENVKRKKKSKTNNLAITHRLKLLCPLYIDAEPLQPKIYLSKQEIKDSALFLTQNKLKLEFPVFMISVLGSTKNKTYPFAFMAHVVDTIVEEQPKAQLLFNYIPNQAEDAKTIFNLCKPKTKDQIYFNVFGKSLRQFLAITYHCDALIGNEGGAVNMAKAMKVKTFSIFSPWIDKASWSLFEEEKNIGVHLKDYYPEYYTKPEKQYKKEALQLYQLFKPELFSNQLKTFLKAL